jgi:hypothetical protein
MTIPPEHDFSKSFKEWEQAVISSATRYTVTVFGVGRYSVDFPTFAAAIGFARDKPRTLVYAVTDTDHSTLVPRDKWEEVLRAKS